MNLQGKRALVQTPGTNEPYLTKVLKDFRTHQNPHENNVEIKDPKGQSWEINRYDKRKIIILVPQKEIHPFWKKTIKLNHHVKMVVGYVSPDNVPGKLRYSAQTHSNNSKHTFKQPNAARSQSKGTRNFPEKVSLKWKTPPPAIS